MMSTNPLLYQVNTRVWIQLLSNQLNRPATLDDIPDTVLDEWVSLGFDWVYFLGVWQMGEAGRRVSLSNPEWVEEHRRSLVDLCDDDVCGSCFAIKNYVVSDRMGGNAAAARLRDRLHDRGLKLMLDFVPNHMAPDHPWVQMYPDYFVHGTEELLVQQPQNYCRVAGEILAYGRDPYFAGWCDTLQLNYGNPAPQAAMMGELLNVAQLCDGVRCDMAMLVLPEIFRNTWGIEVEPFWETAIEKVQHQHPGFVFMAEVYWDMEWTLQQLGFDYTYDKRLYDRLLEQQAEPVRQHFLADLNYQNRSTRFLENHDEPRAANAFPLEVHRAAAIVTFLCPGLRFLHQGQLEGFKHKISVHVQRGPVEAIAEEPNRFYRQLLACLQSPVLRSGRWQLLNCTAAWEGNSTWRDFISFGWEDDEQNRVLVIVNYASHASQCYVTLPYSDLAGQTYLLKDFMSLTIYERPGDSLVSGLYFDMPAWSYHVFELCPNTGSTQQA
ncbi:alpha-amylase family glycosyl hydrolase [Leptolyngbya sp. NIES-2104]|uniref:alpha-amylase family glycosyl hydrolase n=1 Tax=Leptolyngbya sp. NIES-2104 TaxID=1552121 RepID=UPI00073E9E63|nr:alpha-amylase family glycosyl hydrolase [Leptolyngbya sp. NIES-2104]